MAKTKNKDKEKAEKYDRARILANERARRYKAKKTEEQLAKKREQDRISAEKRRVHVKDMSDKDKKMARKVWRERKQKQRRKKKEEEEKEEEEVRENTQPANEDDVPGPIERKQTRQSEAGKKIARKNRLKIMKELKDAKDANKKLQRKLEKLKKRLQREKKKKNPSSGVSPSPSKKLKQIIGNERVSPKIRKQLFCGLVLEKQLKHQVQSVSAKSKLRQLMIKTVGNEFLKKYKLQKKFQSLVPYKYNKVLATKKPSLDYERKKYQTVKIKEALVIRQFYEDDTVSKMMPGKKDYVQKGKVKMQKRVLLDSLYNLYNKFLQETKLSNISRSVFYRCRPWWVYRPQLKDRETCACVKHENVNFLFAALKNVKAIDYRHVDNLLETLVCSVKNEKCMMGLCNECQNKTFEYTTDGIKDEVKYNKWQTVTENKLIKGTLRPIKMVTKILITKKTEQVVKLLQESLATYKKHVFQMYHQAKMLKHLKKSINEREILFQVDFSQNYMAKFTSEIQSVHFGASSKQISLHTGAKYTRKEGEVCCTTFCTVSDNLDHHAHGVWSHMKDILNGANEEFPNTETVHFFSDSPSSQYRNKTNVYLMSLLLPRHFKNLSSFSWNFSEAGHGKGVMDGVGGSIKRNSDLLVLHQNDITCAKDLVSLFTSSKTQVLEVPSQTFDEVKSLIPPSLNPIEGIMSVKQITWSKKNGSLQFRRLSCFNCPPDTECEHFHLFSITADGKQISSKKTIKTRGKNVRSRKPEEPAKKKTVLKVSDVYSDEEDFHEEPAQLNENYGYDDLKQGAFIVVTFQTGGKKKVSKDYAAVILSNENLDDREINVMFLKRYKNDDSLFVGDENDESYISVDQIKGILPQAEMIFKGDRLYHKFPGPVSLN